MSGSKNAARSRDGYAFQEVVALYLLLIWREKIVEVNIEGIEDIDIKTKNGDYIFLQAKNFQNAYDSSTSTAKLKETIRVLANDASKYSNIESLVYVTNSTVPFPMRGKNKVTNKFDSEYAYYLFQSLTPDIQNKIQIDIDALISSTDDKISSEVKADLLNFKMSDNLEKFATMKFRYEGDDRKSKIDLLRKETERILTLARIPSQEHDVILGAWQDLVVDSATHERISITKSKFIGQTLNATIFYRSPVEEFANKFKLLTSEEDILKDHHKKLMERLNERYEIISNVSFEANKKFHSASWANLTRDEQHTKFINEFSTELSEMAGFNIDDPHDLILAKFTIWSVLKYSTYMNGIQEVFS